MTIADRMAAVKFDSKQRTPPRHEQRRERCKDESQVNREWQPRITD